MQGKQYALIVVCKQFLDADDYELQMEDSEEWIVPKGWKVVEVEPTYKKVLSGYIIVQGE